MLYDIDVSEHNGKINWSASDEFKGFMWQYTDRKEINGKLFDGNVPYEYGVDF